MTASGLKHIEVEATAARVWFRPVGEMWNCPSPRIAA